MRRRGRKVCRLFTCVFIWLIYYYLGDMIFLTQESWKIAPDTNEHGGPNKTLQYFSRVSNSYGKKFDVSPHLMNDLHLTLHRQDFVQVTEGNRFVCVTAGDSNHYSGVYSLVVSIQRRVFKPVIIVYDLGLSETEREELASSCGVQIRQFNFAKYPSHVRNLWTYAWKPLMIHEVLNEWPLVVWLDSSSRMATTYVDSAYHAAQRTGGFVFFSRADYSLYSVTHPTMYHYLPTDTEHGKRTMMIEAGDLMVYRTEDVYSNIIYWWVLCALDPNCIAPAKNWICVWNLKDYLEFLYCHKYDMSALNILVQNRYSFRLDGAKPSRQLFVFIRHGPKVGELRYC